MYIHHLLRISNSLGECDESTITKATNILIECLEVTRTKTNKEKNEFIFKKLVEKDDRAGYNIRSGDIRFEICRKCFCVAFNVTDDRLRKCAMKLSQSGNNEPSGNDDRPLDDKSYHDHSYEDTRRLYEENDLEYGKFIYHSYSLSNNFIHQIKNR